MTNRHLVIGLVVVVGAWVAWRLYAWQFYVRHVKPGADDIKVLQGVFFKKPFTSADRLD